MPFVVGENVGPYRIIEQLGQGGMATVFKAYHPALDRYVALKALHPAFTQEANFLVRFQREAQVVARLEHPNIVPVYDYAEHEGRPYLVMKYIEGETLKSRLQAGSLAMDEINRIVESVGAALEYAHQQGVLHRDVKPSNVLLANDGRIYLADFGLARMAQAGESTISSDMMLGTPQYISPEQARSQRDLDNGTDIYSFGVLIYELVVGKVPYQADTPYAIIHDHIYTPLPLPHSVNPQISEPVERVLLKALAKERADRFPDVATLVSAWMQAAGESPAADAVPLQAGLPPQDSTVLMAAAETGSLPPVAAAAAAAPRRRSKALWIGLALVLGLGCLFLAAALVLAPRLQRIKRAASAAVGTRPPAAAPASPIPPPAGQPPAVLPPPGGPPPAMTVDEAQRQVNANPDDPQAYLNLAMAYMDGGNGDLAEQALRTALDKAGPDLAFQARVGEALLQKQAYLRAASLYLDMLKGAGQPAPRLVERLDQALYQAAGDPGLNDLLLKAPADLLPPGVLDTVRARQALLTGERPRVVLATAQALMRRYPRLREAQLLSAEALIKAGQLDEAKVKLQALLDDPATPEWIRQVAASLQNQ